MPETIEQWNARIDVAKRAKFLAQHGPLALPPEPKAGSRNAFKRAKAMYMQILELRQRLSNNLPALQVALNDFPAYRSRGHGWTRHLWQRTILGDWTQDRSKYQPHQGKSECARRVFQVMPAVERAFVRRIEGDVLSAGDIE